MIVPVLQSSPFVSSPTGDAGAMTIISRDIRDPADPSSLTQRQQLLWMSLGIYIGILALSFIAGGLDKARGGVQKQLKDKISRIALLESDLNESRRQIGLLRGEVSTKDGEISRDRHRKVELQTTIGFLRPFEVEARTLRTEIMDLREMNRDLEATADVIAVRNLRLAPFEREANDLRPQVGHLRDAIRRKEEEVVALELSLRDMTAERDRAGAQYTFVQQQIVEQHLLGEELKAQLRATEETLQIADTITIVNRN